MAILTKLTISNTSRRPQMSATEHQQADQQRWQHTSAVLVCAMPRSLLLNSLGKISTF